MQLELGIAVGEAGGLGIFEEEQIVVVYKGGLKDGLDDGRD